MSVGSARPARRDPYTRAQWYCLVVGILLVIFGLVGFAADGSFHSGHHVQGHDLIVFEVNGWHNLLHIATGLLLLSGVSHRRSAKMAALTFGVLYVAIAIYGFVDGDEVAGIFPVDVADNVLHAVLAATALLAAILSRSHYEAELSVGHRLRAHAGA